MPLPPIPAPALVVVQAPRALGVLGELLAGPAAVCQLDQALQRGGCRQGAAVLLAVAAVARQRPRAEQPALRARGDAGMAGGELRARRGLILWCRTWLLRLAAAPGALGRYERCCPPLLWEAPPTGAAHASHIRHRPLVEPLQAGGLVAVACVGDAPGTRHAPGAGLIDQGARHTGLV
jgi:hypothetical protein